MKNKHFLLQLFFLFTCQIIAQELSQFPFIRTSTQPEMYLYEPHYDTNYKVTHYTYGNSIKVAYTFDEQQRPIRKDLFTWDKKSLEWEKNGETFYTYQDGRLIEERTQQMLPYEQEDEVIYLNTTTQLKTIAYNAQYHTDTIITTIYLPSIDHFTSHADTTITINYYNQQNLPDSAIIREIYPNKELLTKEVYHYNKKKNPVRIETFIGYKDTSWKLIHETNIFHTKEQITYIQTTTYDLTEPVSDYIDHNVDINQWIQKEEVQDVTRKNNKNNELETVDLHTQKDKIPDQLQKSEQNRREEKLVFNIRFDNHKRITEKTFDVNGKQLLTSRYIYDKQGRTSVEQKQELTPQFLSLFGIRGIDISELPLKYTITNANNCRKTTYYNTNQHNDTIRSLEVENCFNPKGWLLRNTFGIFDPVSGGPKEVKSIEYHYNSDDGLSGESIEHHIFFGDYMIEKYTIGKTDFRNDTKGRPLEQTNYYLQKYDSTWIARNKYIYQYDQHGSLALFQEYESVYEGWEGKSAYEREYDDRKRVTTEKQMIWNYNKWEWDNYRLSNYLYDDRHDKKTLDERYEWNPDTRQWEWDRRNTLRYDDDGVVIENISYRWDEERKDWYPNRKYEYYREETDSTYIQEETYFYYAHAVDDWLRESQQFKRQRQYNKFHETGRSFWNRETQEWDIRALNRNYITEDGAHVKEEYHIHEPTRKLAGWNHIETRHSTNPHIRPDQYEEITYSLWDYDKKRWKKAIRYTLDYPTEEGTRTFEVYHPATNTWQNERLVKDTIHNAIKVREEHFWDTRASVWIPKRKQEIIPASDQYDFLQLQSYTYDALTRKWTPCILWQKQDRERTDLYLQWNASQKQWVNYVKIIHTDRHSRKVYRWNTNKKDWAEVEFYAGYELHDQLNDIFIIAEEVDYNQLKEDNYPSEEE